MEDHMKHLEAIRGLLYQGRCAEALDQANEAVALAYVAAHSPGAGLPTGEGGGGWCVRHDMWHGWGCGNGDASGFPTNGSGWSCGGSDNGDGGSRGTFRGRIIRTDLEDPGDGLLGSGGDWARSGAGRLTMWAEWEE